MLSELWRGILFDGLVTDEAMYAMSVKRISEQGTALVGGLEGVVR